MRGYRSFLTAGVMAICTAIMGISVFGQGDDSEKKLSSETSIADRSAGNPVKATPKSIEAGKKLFSDKCKVCHGEKADGNGEMADMLDTKPANLTDPQGVGKLTDKQIFSVLANGKSAMPKFGNLPESDRWNLVNFVRSVETKSAEPNSDADKKN
jgi:mono/diheme cytochrome c family protein